MNKNLKIFLVSCLITIASLMPWRTIAQIGGGGSENPDNPDTGVPFDGGVSLLVAAGVAYGAKKAHEAKKKSSGDSGKVA